MTTQSIETVIAGSKAFAIALLGPLAERVGTRPRVAADPAHAAELCKEGGLVVVEFQGEASLRAIEALRRAAAAVRLVVAVPVAHDASVPALRALGADLARWDGRPDAVLGVVTRLLGKAAAAAAPAVAKPVAAPLAAAKPVVAPPAAAKPVVAPPAAAKPAAAKPVAAKPVAGLPGAARPAPVAAPAAPPPPTAPAPAAAGTWPSNVPGQADSAAAIARRLAGKLDPPGTIFGAVGAVLGNLTDLERAVLSGAPQAVDVEPVRRAAVMRVRM
ncbi:MAG TPA: hypothetical protein VF875_06255, partial [Anaeromyxobacter sp.]